jgi:hypothetical protein
MTANARIITSAFHRVQRGRGKRFVAEPPQGPVRGPARVAVMLALAHKIQQAIDRGQVRNRAEIARRLGFTRARMTQMLNLSLLAADIQEQVLFLDAVDGVQPMSERALRAVARAGSWAEQRTAFSSYATSTA